MTGMCEIKAVGDAPLTAAVLPIVEGDAVAFTTPGACREVPLVAPDVPAHGDEVPRWENFNGAPESLAEAVKSVSEGIGKREVGIGNIVPDAPNTIKEPLVGGDKRTVTCEIFTRRDTADLQAPARDAATIAPAPAAPAATPAATPTRDVAPAAPAVVTPARDDAPSTPVPTPARDAALTAPAATPARDAPTISPAALPEEPIADEGVESPRIADSDDVLRPSTLAPHSVPHVLSAEPVLANTVAAPAFTEASPQSAPRAQLAAAATAVVEAIAVSPALASTGEGEIRIQLKADVLDGSSIRLEAKSGELKIVVTPATRAAEETLLRHQESFQNHLAERVANWRVNVGVSQWGASPRSQYFQEDEQ